MAVTVAFWKGNLGLEDQAWWFITSLDVVGQLSAGA
jgi:hypothetical protein